MQKFSAVLSSINNKNKKNRTKNVASLLIFELTRFENARLICENLRTKYSLINFRLVKI